MKNPSFIEDHSSQIPALLFLNNLGYKYLTPDQALEKRNFDVSNVLLDKVVLEQLAKINSFSFKGTERKFHESAIKMALSNLKELSLFEGANIANEKMYDLLSLGKSYEQNIDGDKKSFTLNFIDWDHPENNVFHVTEEFEVRRIGSEATYRPDIVLFVNGIPLVVIECKRPDLTGSESPEKKPINQAISQHLRNQNIREGIPQLFAYSQILLALGVNDARYGTSGTGMEFWAEWKESFAEDFTQSVYRDKVIEFKNKKLENSDFDLIFSDRFRYVKGYFQELFGQKVETTKQDEILYSLCSKQRLLEIIYRFIVFDSGIKKVARYQQYFATIRAMKRLKNISGGKREGGIIWHTQGSGKSLTMVMMAKCLALEPTIKNHKVIVVTDRIDLDKQIHDTFLNCGLSTSKESPRAHSGTDLLKKLKSSSTLITTVNAKFDSFSKSTDYSNPSSDIFVLVDESHRSVWGETFAQMQKVLPNACYIGFTGTPLMKKDKNNVSRFGGFIDKYTIDQAVKDGAVVPLLYEGRHVVQEVNDKPIDEYFQLITADLNDEQKAELKKKFAQADQLNQADQKLYRIAWDISLHYSKEWQGTGFKAQLASPSKEAAIKFKQYFDSIGKVKTEVIISGPDTREGHEEVYEAEPQMVDSFWQNMMSKYGSEQRYNDSIIESFKKSEQPEILIVVDKLLTGFDAPVNTILYIARSLKEHNLLQAIARVNRVMEGKDFGYIIDYYGLLGELDQALTTYSALNQFDEEDLDGALISTAEEIAKLKQYHADVWEIFKEIKNRKDLEAYERLLADEEIRQTFYKRVNYFAKCLKIALSTLEFIQTTDPKFISEYKEDVTFFLNLRASVRCRYSEGIDYSKYEKQIQKLIDTHVGATEVVKLTEQVNILDKENFQKELEKVQGTAAKADTIATRTQQTISGVIDENPIYYRNLSTLLKQIIDDYRNKRISEVDYLKKANEIADKVINHPNKKYPELIRDNENAQVYYDVLEETFADVVRDASTESSTYGEVAGKLDDIFQENIITDWKTNSDVKNKIQQDIDDYLYNLEKKSDLPLTEAKRDIIIASALKVALRRYKNQKANETTLY